MLLAFVRQGQADKIMVIGGDDDLDVVASVEIVDLLNPTATCSPVAEYPYPIYSLTAGFVDGQVIACGGEVVYKDPMDTCFTIGRDLAEWKPSQPLPYGYAKGLRSSMLGGKWVITGGAYRLQEVLSYEEGIFSPLEALPIGKTDHCQVSINDTQFFLAGGFTTELNDRDSEQSFFFNMDTSEYIQIEDMPSTLEFTACGLVESRQFGREVVVVGHERTYILSLSTLQWRDGPAFSADGSVNYWGYSQLGEDTFILVGGRGVMGLHYALDSIYSFDQKNYQWTLQEAKLDVGRFYPGVVALPDDFVECV